MGEVDLVPVVLPDMDAVKSRLAQRVSALASAAARVVHGRHGAEDLDAIHDLRVSARSLDAMLRTWAGLLDAQPRAAALRALRRLRRRLGAARELEVHVALLERTASVHGEPVTRLLHALRHKLARRTARAAKRLRPNRLRGLLRRVEAAASSLRAQPIGAPHGVDRARARVAEVRAVALAAVESARAREDDWLLRQARLAVKKWRYSVESIVECIDPPANGFGTDLRPALRQVQDVLGAIQDRAALIDSVERYAHRQAQPGFRALIEELKAEKRAAFRSFQALAEALEFPSAAPAASVRVIRGPVERATANAAPVSTDERWERMAQWLLGTTPER